jgi:putative phosphoserine phosphatase/1-acylglycerol-3-phosphate O-acyltransferase
VRPAAVFDLDGTLVRGTSVERLLVPWLVRRGVIGARQLTAAALVAATYPLLGRTRALRRNKRWISGVEVEAVAARMEVFLDEAVAPRWCQPVVTRMEELRASGHALFLLSGAPDFVVRAVGAHLRVDGVTATPMEIVGGRFTGRLAGAHVFGSRKLTALRKLAEEHDLDLQASWGFADHLSDVDFLADFGTSVVVDPGSRLRRIAEARGWELVEGA